MDIDNLILLPITTKAVCFCCMLNVFEASWANNVDPEQTVAVCFCAYIIVNNLNKYIGCNNQMQLLDSFLRLHQT